MAISHLCLQCGADLAPVRAQREPIYGLPLVICPWCGTAAVRRVHPLRQRWRTMQRLSIALGILGGQAMLLAGFITLTIIVCVHFADLLVKTGLDAHEPDNGFVLALCFGALPVALGAWLTAGLSHWRRLAAWGSFGGLLLICLSFDTIIAPAFTQLTDGLNVTAAPIDCRWSPWAARVAVLLALLSIAGAGLPVGRLILAGLALTRSLLWRRRLRRQRARRTK